MEAVHQGLPIAYTISLASLKSSRPGQSQRPALMKATCVEPQGECSFRPGPMDLVSFFASKANGFQMGAPLEFDASSTTQFPQVASSSYGLM
jgi:hypothetical protein